jgi:hypothetical protein
MKRLAAALFAAVVAACSAGGPVTASGDIRIPKNGVSASATFYPYKSGDITGEVLALRAPDGTIRTAFNTCQVCYSSGRGYYVQQGDVLVCQNCGNRFRASQVELIRGGCNPIPITGEDKRDDGDSIAIPRAVLDKAAPIFVGWKKR